MHTLPTSQVSSSAGIKAVQLKQAPEAKAASIALHEIAPTVLGDRKNVLILFAFPEGSVLGVTVEDVINKTAQRLCINGVSADSIVAQQLLPLLEDNFSMLAEFARSMTMDDILLLASEVCMHSPGAFLRQAFKPSEATLSIAVPRRISN